MGVAFGAQGCCCAAHDQLGVVLRGDGGLGASESGGLGAEKLSVGPCCSWVACPVCLGSSPAAVTPDGCLALSADGDGTALWPVSIRPAA
ncbi:hypothetical protein ABZ922_14570 [Streptomyces shenzhenensis]|uniref:hypothetical protein n=1 Tax=Streptomyces shenzhenensis TaxID=943815 RepID=UPI0033E6F70E